jgi:hypothetical protein
LATRYRSRVASGSYRAAVKSRQEKQLKIRTSTVVAISALAMIATVASTAEAKLPSLHVAPAKQSVSGNSKDRRPLVAKRLAVKQKVHTKTKTIVVIRYVLMGCLVVCS